MTRDCRLLVNGQLAVAPRHVDRIDDIDVPSRKGFKLTAHAVRVVALQYVGLRQTYDLSIEGPWHNFVANGLVVHNSFNEFSMRYAKATDDFYVPEADDVRSQVGKPGAYSFEPVSQELAEETRQELEALYKEAYATYARLVEKGVARELARAVMPVGAYTQFYWTVNAQGPDELRLAAERRVRPARDPALRGGRRGLLRRADADHPCGVCCKRPHGTST